MVNTMDGSRKLAYSKQHGQLQNQSVYLE